jgi:hypothetical protein
MESSIFEINFILHMKPSTVGMELLKVSYTEAVFGFCGLFKSCRSRELYFSEQLLSAEIYSSSQIMMLSQCLPYSQNIFDTC